MIKLDLACGQSKFPGFIGVDLKKIEGVDIKLDLEKYPWPWGNNSVEEIYCSHFVEHVDDLIRFMDECYRILKPMKKMVVRAPYYTSIQSMQDPTHKRPISEATFFYFNKEWREVNTIAHYPIKSDFDVNYGYIFYPNWGDRPHEERLFAMTHYFNVVSDIQVNLIKRPQ